MALKFRAFSVEPFYTNVSLHSYESAKRQIGVKCAGIFLEEFSLSAYVHLQNRSYNYTNGIVDVCNKKV